MLWLSYLLCVCVCAGVLLKHRGPGAGAVTAGPGFHFFVYWCVVKTRSLRVCCHPTFFPLFCRSARARSDGVTVWMKVSPGAAADGRNEVHVTKLKHLLVRCQSRQQWCLSLYKPEGWLLQVLADWCVRASAFSNWMIKLKMLNRYSLCRGCECALKCFL